VVRLYESERSGTETEITFGFPAAVAETNLLEEERRPLTLRDGRVRLRLRPFEIKTLYVDIREPL